MKFLPHSNGVYKISTRKKLNKTEILKLTSIILVAILVVGFIAQRINNFVVKETMKQRVDYVRVNNERFDYVLEGSGDFTVVFDNSMGANLNQWDGVVEELKDEGVTTFTYNRSGYGFSDSTDRRTIEEQASDLKILLRKAAIPEPYILVGEQYGSLVLTEFAKLYPESVAGVVLVNPPVQEELASKEVSKKYRGLKYRNKIEKFGSNFALTLLLDKIGLDYEFNDFEQSLDEEDLDEYRKHRVEGDYNKAISNELKTFTSGEVNVQAPGVFSGKPYYLIHSGTNEKLVALGDEHLTESIKTTIDSDFIAIKDSERVANGIKTVLKEARRIERDKLRS